MSPLLLIVFAPVVIGGIAFVALLLGAAAAGSWESFEEHRDEEAAPAVEPVILPYDLTRASGMSRPPLHHRRARRDSEISRIRANILPGCRVCKGAGRDDGSRCEDGSESRRPEIPLTPRSYVRRKFASHVGLPGSETISRSARSGSIPCGRDTRPWTSLAGFSGPV